jgi:hypothetical protein
MAQSYSDEKSLPVQVQTYHSYLLRFWEERAEGASVWRFTLEDPQTGKRQGFADLENLTEWLRSCTDGVPDLPFRHSKEDKHR